MGFTTALRSDWVQGEDRIVTTQPLIYFDKKTGRDFVVPIGFYSDGASVPRFLWAVVGHPFNKDVREAAVLHDFLYFSGIVSRAEADRIFREAMQWSGAKWYKRYIYWSGVRAGGWKPWNGYRRKNSEKVHADFLNSDAQQLRQWADYEGNV